MDRRDFETPNAVDSEPTNWMVIAAGIVGLVLIIGLFAYNSTTGDDRASAPSSTQASKTPASSTTGQAPACALIGLSELNSRLH